MSHPESIFNPLNDSLAERVRAYYSVCQAFTLSQASLKQTERMGDVGYLGEEHEVKDAFKVINQSLTQANSEISKTELQDAKEKGLLSSQQLLEIVQVQRSQEMAQNRASHQFKDQASLKR